MKKRDGGRMRPASRATKKTFRYNPAHGLFRVFAGFARRQPDAAAVVSGESPLSYGQLHAQAEAIAADLIARGVRKGDYVGLLARRAPETLAAILGILRAGAAYVPLDPGHAPDRFPFIFADIAPGTVLYQDALADMAEDLIADASVRHSISAALASDAPKPGRWPTVTGESAAHVMYTSGTTGQPKGVIVAQRGVFATNVDQSLKPIGKNDVVLHAATLACDGATFEIWSALLNGASLAILENEKPALGDIAAVMTRYKTTAALIYTGMFHLMVDHHPEAFATMRYQTVGGDVLSPGHAARIIARYPDMHLINIYGPTETTVSALATRITPQMAAEGPLPIGAPHHHYDVFVVDPDNAPLRAGETGQIAIAGAGVGLGYHNLPDRTAQSFIDDPREGHKGLVYLTGDLGRMGDDGLFRFLGRVDRQVKLGGRRIELDGVEHVLRRLAGVADAVVEVVEIGGDRRLSAAIRPAAPVSDEVSWLATLRREAESALNSGEIPRRMRIVTDMPLTPAGKVDRARIRELLAKSEPAAHPKPQATDIRALVVAIWDDLLSSGDPGDAATFFDAGGTSLQLIDAHARIEAALGITFDVTLMFETPRLGALVARLGDLTAVTAPQPTNPQPAKARPAHDIAIIGMGGRLPGVASLGEFWAAVREGRNLIPRFRPDEMEDTVSAADRADPAYVAARPVLDDADMFDAACFDILPREAAEMDPQGRVMLEVALEALEDAGLDPGRARGAIGVWAGSSMSTYLLNNILGDRARADEFTSTFQIGNYGILTGNIKDSLSTRIAYKLDLRGPAVSVSTACSTSLTAVIEAVAALRAGLCDAALAGGVSITFPQKRGYFWQEGGMGSKDGTCRPFDADASGTVFGHGAGMVVLKRLEDALDDGDRIHAVIRGIGLNNDGADKMSYTAPSVGGQAAAIMAAHRDAAVASDSITYVECHGTATPLGDPIEVKALAQAFGPGKAGTCALGSAKGNLGHLDAAAGIVGVIKAVLALKAQEIPPVAHFKAPNPRIDFAATPFYVPSALTKWVTDGPRLAGVSAFGVGGTNTHVVLEEAPPGATAIPAETGIHLLPLSAKSPEAVAAMAANLANVLALPDAPAMADIATTLQDGRRALPWRATIAARDTAGAAAALRALRPAKKANPGTEIVFLFPGQGAQYPGMGSGLYHADKGYRAVIDDGAALLQPMLGLDLRHLLLADRTDKTAAEDLRDTRLAQPALYLTELAIAQMWLARGLKPAALVGHSVGEFAAATVAGIIAFEDAIRVIAERGRLMQDLPKGGMLSVRAPLDALLPHLDASLDIAARNAPSLQVVAGPDAEIEALAARLTEAGIAHSRLNTSHAFHSRMMHSVTPALAALLSEIDLNAPDIPCTSAVTGDWLTPEQACDPAHWAGQARAQVNFQAAIQTACQSRSPVLLEVGAGGTLSALSRQALKRGGHDGIFQSLPDHTQSADDELAVATAFGDLWAAGLPLDWAVLGQGRGRKVALPTYPFRRQRHWIEPPHAAQASTPAALPTPQTTIPTEKAIQMTASAPLMSDRKPRLVTELLALFGELSGGTLAQDEAATPFLELGFDSLFMGQAATALNRQYKVDLTFRGLLSDTPSIALLAAHLDNVLPPETRDVPQTAPVAGNVVALPGAAAIPAPATAELPPTGGDLAAVMQAQMATMQAVFSQQLQIVGGQTSRSSSAQAQPAAAAAAPPAAATQAVAPTTEAAAKPAFRIGRGPNLAHAEFSDAQRAFAAALADRYAARFPASKAHTAAHRKHHADPRTAAGFRPEWKELVFPIVSDRSKGAYIWDIDGNRFVDLVNGFGQTAFGHAPDFVLEAVKAQADRGFAIGPQTDTAGPVAEKFARATGHERVTFCNTGSEAIMSAMRLARSITGREKVVVFSNDYHGQFDEVLIKGGRPGGAPTALPIAPGIPRSGLANMVVLDYGTEASLDWLRANGEDVAAVVVEPVQSRHPEVRSAEFVRQIRVITKDTGTAFVMDEVVTGFRTARRGMQEVWDIEADLAAYGKVVGGGMPCGILAGKARFMDALDGGQWVYGDDSIPEVAPTFVAGTFVRHPLVLAAIDAVLDHLEENGDRLWSQTADKAANLAGQMNDYLVARGLPRLIDAYSSWFVINVTRHDPRATLLFPLMRMEGVHIMDGFCGFLTTEHSDEDLNFIRQAFEKSVDTLQEQGILLGEAQTAVARPAASLPAEIALTSNQSEIWMIHQLGDRAAASFNESLSMRLDGPLDRDALQSALDAVLARHDALRMRFARDGSTFHIAEVAPFDCPYLDLSDRADPEAELAAFLDENAATPVDIVGDAPIRAALVRLRDEAHVLVLTAHHIAVDGWSYGVLLGDLAALYAAKCDGRAADLPEAPSFGAHALREAGRKPRAATLGYWRDVYGDLPEAADLPGDRTRPAVRSFAGATLRDTLDADQLARIRKAGAKQGCTLFATLFGALGLTLGRLSASNDLAICVPTAGQADLPDPTLVGHLVNLLPVRTGFEASQTAADYLKSTSGNLMKAFDNQDITLGTLVRALDVPRGLNRMPLSEIQFNLETAPEGLDMPGLKVTARANAKAATNFDLFVNTVQSGDGLAIEVDYNTDLFDAETVGRWVGLFRATLAAIAEAPETLIRDLPASDSGDVNPLVAANEAASRDFDLTARIETLVAEAAASHPDRVAVECGTTRLSHGELAAASDALAALVQRQAGTTASRVAVALPRSTTMVVALLATLKAGHAYVPLDPDQPAARLRRILETAGVTALLTDQTHPDFAAGLDLQLIDPADAVAGEKPAALHATSDDAAYLIFTSGSTGQPKGVEIPHKAVVNFLSSMRERPGFAQDHSILAVTTAMFDIAVLELFLPLVTGGRSVVAPRDMVVDGFALAKRLEAGDITHLQATPTLWQILLEAGFKPSTGFTCLAGGEPLPEDLAQRIVADGATLWNLYGPTETTIWSAQKQIIAGGKVTIGGPIANTELLVLDAAGQPVPTGTTGELFIGGAGLAKGYVGRDDLTAAAFSDRTIGGRTRRLYRSGDLARVLPDGEIEVLGRSDAQIKLRGYRIELGEIETTLRGLDGVTNAAVALKSRANGDRYLAAYVVTRETDAIPEEFAAELARTLPDYMLPQVWVSLAALPQTANGKLDRKALPEPGLPANVAPLRAHVEAESPTEQKIAAIWCTVLGQTAISATDSLYALGADSLTIFRIAARMLDEGLQLEARDLLAHPSIRDLAAFADSRSVTESAPSRPSLKAYMNGARRGTTARS